MKKKITLLVVMVFMTIFQGHAQTQFWSDTFDSTPSSGTRTPEENGGTTSPSTSYFKLTNGSDISQVVPFTGKEGSMFWAGEDHNATGTGFTASGAEGATPANNPNNELHIIWSGINISGKSGLSFKGLIAAASTNEPWDNTTACISGVGTTNTDYIIVEYQIDGGAYTPLIRFFNRGSASGTGDKYLFEDTDANGCGDGIQLTNAFAEFSKTITGTGTSLNLRIRVFSEGNNEEWGIDNFRLFETPSCTAPVVTAHPSNRSICAGSNTTFSTAATGATGYQWQVDTGSGFTNISNGAPYSNATTNTLTITGATALMSGYTYRCVTYNGTITCFTNTNQGILSISSINTSVGSQSNVSCNGGTNGIASVSPSGGIGSYTYSWAPSGGTGAIASGLAAGTYTVTVTDALGCQATKTYTITQPAVALAATTSKTDVSCNGGSNGTATVAASGGTPSYTYSWAPSGGTAATASGLAAGTYTCTITDANSCQITRTVTVGQPTAALAATTSKTDVSCNGGSNGTASVSASGGTPSYTYSWAPSGGTAATASGLAAGTYTCTITDANACQITRTVTVNQPTSALAATTSKTDVSCNGGSNGTASVAASGGTPSYTYSWAPSGGTAATASGLAAGTYTCTITDANACQITRTVTVNQPTAALAATTSKTDVSCNGGSNGSATVNVTGGTGTYTYSWAPSGGTAATAAGLAAGTYTCTITDANNCQTTQSFTITEPSALSVTDSQTDVSCNGGTNGTATVNVTGGTGSYTYSWSPSGGTAATASGLTAGTYTCTITDANNCQTTQSFTITEPVAFNITNSHINVSCNGAANGSATVSVTGGTGAYTYSWAPTGGTAATASGLAPGTYTCTITDANACQTTSTFTISEPAALDNSITLNGTTLTATQTGATYQWIDCSNGNTPLSGETNQDFTPTVSGDYAVIVTMGSCSVTSSCSTVLGTVDFESSINFIVYPNPSTGIITLKSNFDGQFQLINQLGQLVRTVDVVSGIEKTIELENIAKGIYHLSGITKEGVKVNKKIILN